MYIMYIVYNANPEFHVGLAVCELYLTRCLVLEYSS
jgi:hypothetical protein